MFRKVTLGLIAAASLGAAALALLWVLELRVAERVAPGEVAATWIRLALWSAMTLLIVTPLLLIHLPRLLRRRGSRRRRCRSGGASSPRRIRATRAGLAGRPSPLASHARG